MVLDLVIIGLAITLEPVTLVAFILILGAEQGVWKGLAFILGWMACLVAVIAAAVLVTRGKPPAPHTAPSAGALVVRALLGVVLIWAGLRRWRRMGRPRKQPSWMARLNHLSLWARCRAGCLPAAMDAGGGRSGNGGAGQAVHSGRLADADLVLPAGYVEFPGHGVVHGVRAGGGGGSL